MAMGVRLCVLCCAFLLFQANVSFAMTLEEARSAIAEKHAALGKAKSEYMDLCNTIIADTTNEPKVRAFALAVRGRLYCRFNDQQRGKQDLDASLQLDDSIPTGYLGLGELAAVNGDYAGAVENYKKAEARATTEEGRKMFADLIATAQGALNEQKSSSKALNAQKPSPAVSGGVTLPVYDIAAYCKKLAAHGGGSYTVEASCIDMETDEKNTLEKMTDVPERILNQCAKLAGFGGSYTVLRSCIDMELEAKSKLEKK